MARRTDERRLRARQRERREWARTFVRDVARSCGGRPAETLELLEFLLGDCYHTELAAEVWRQAFRLFASRRAA